jgi:hypothetical protein
LTKLAHMKVLRSLDIPSYLALAAFAGYLLAPLFL